MCIRDRTKVSVTPDLQLARVYYTTLGDEKAQKETDKALHRASPFLRRQIAQRVRLRRVPEIEFFYDKSIAQHDRVERILQELKAEADARPPAPDEQSGDLGAAASEPAGGSGPPSPRRGFGEVSPEPVPARTRTEADGAKAPGLINDDSKDRHD